MALHVATYKAEEMTIETESGVIDWAALCAVGRADLTVIDEQIERIIDRFADSAGFDAAFAQAANDAMRRGSGTIVVQLSMDWGRGCMVCTPLIGVDMLTGSLDP